MSVRFLFSIGCLIALAGVAGSLAVDRYAAHPRADGSMLARCAKGLTYLGAAVAAFAMVSGLITG